MRAIPADRRNSTIDVPPPPRIPELFGAEGVPGLWLAASQGDAEDVAALLVHAPEQIELAVNGMTPLLAAAANGHAGIVRELLRAGADAEFRNPEGSAALHVAAKFGHEDVTAELLETAPWEQINRADEFGATPLLVAAAQGNVAVAGLLLHAHAQPNAVLKDGTTCLFLAAQGGHVDMMRLMLQRAPLQLTVVREDGMTPLMAAADNGHLEAVQLLLEEGDIDLHAARESDGASALFLAAARGHTEIVKAILLDEDGPTLAAQEDIHGALPISIAVEYGNTEVVKLLEPLTSAAPVRRTLFSPERWPPKCWQLTGDDVDSGQGELRATAASGTDQVELQFVGDGGPLPWGTFVQQLHSAEVQGSTWFVSAHGSPTTESDTRHRLQFTPTELVGTSEVVRLLAEWGVHTIHIRTCFGERAVAQISRRMERDPLWPRHRGMYVVIHAEEEFENLSVLDSFETEVMIHDLAHPEGRLRFPLLSLTSRTTLAYDSATREVHTSRIQAPDVAEIMRRLPDLEPPDQRQLVGNYMVKCCQLGWAAELALAIKTFPSNLVDVNFVPLHGRYCLLSFAARHGFADVVTLLLEQPGILRNGIGFFTPKQYAAKNGHDHIVDILSRVDRVPS
jgi:ankyrin repeat protein